MNTPRDHVLTRAITIYPNQDDIIQELADAEYDGNYSLAARVIISHYGKCQLPLLGIEMKAKDRKNGN